MEEACLDFTNGEDGEETENVEVPRGREEYELWAYMSITVPTIKVESLWGKGKSLEGAILIIPRHVRSTYEVKGRTSTKPMLFIKSSDIRNWAHQGGELDEESSEDGDGERASKDLIQAALPSIFKYARSKVNAFYNAERITGFKRTRREASVVSGEMAQKQIRVEPNQSHRKKK